MLRQALERFPTEVEPIEIRIGIFELRHDADRVGVVVEAARIGECGAERVLARMAERRMAEIVREAERLGQILVEAERARHRSPDLRDFEAVGEPNPIMVAIRRDEHLCLVPEAAERDRMDDAVAVVLEDVTRAARTR